jgi:Ca-activated chloride channel homolog
MEPGMKQCTGGWLLAFGVALVVNQQALSADDLTDASIVTGLDMSNSIDLDELRQELVSLAHAVRDPRVMTAIKAGKRGRIGFAVFAWHHGQFPAVVPWMIIASPQDAEVAARAIEARQLVDIELEGRAQVEWYIGRLTDISEAIEYADAMLLTAPYAASRAVINIVGNGEDNVGEDSAAARDRFVARGGTINGLVLGDDPEMIAYYRDWVIGGRASFVMSVSRESAMSDALVRKLIADIVARAPNPPPYGPAIASGL